MRHGKSIHWHIDGLTEAVTVLGAWTFPGGDECDLVTTLTHLPMAIEGFGSTDCRKCEPFTAVATRRWNPLPRGPAHADHTQDVRLGPRLLRLE